VHWRGEDGVFDGDAFGLGVLQGLGENGLDTVVAGAGLGTAVGGGARPVPPPAQHCRVLVVLAVVAQGELVAGVNFVGLAFDMLLAMEVLSDKMR
jgi:hypothetical protein